MLCLLFNKSDSPIIHLLLFYWITIFKAFGPSRILKSFGIFNGNLNEIAPLSLLLLSVPSHVLYPFSYTDLNPGCLSVGGVGFAFFHFN